jgi:zinc protease
VLPNGMTVLARANFSSPSVSVNGYVTAGSLAESDQKLGLADFVASALLRGTASRSFDQIYDELEAVGASLGYDSGVHSTGFGGRSLVEDLPLLVGLLAESLQFPTFPESELEKLRAQLLTGLAIRAQDTGDMASLTFDQILFDGHPYSRPADGFPETIRAITRQDLVSFHRSYFGPRGMVIAIVGAIRPQAAIDEVRGALAGWNPEGQVDLPALPEHRTLPETRRRHQQIPEKSQSDIVMGMLGPRRKDPDFMAASLANSILGQFGMMGRIGASVRERSGLAYYAHSSLNSGMGPGSWEIGAGVNPANVEKAVRLIVEELERFVKDGVTEEELTDSQSNFIGRLPLSLESNSGVAGALVNIERYQLGPDYYRQYADLVSSVGRDAVADVTRKYIHSDRLAVATAGP